MARSSVCQEQRGPWRERNGLEGDFRDGEFAGATYSPDGRWLFFNAQTPGISFAVTGPWKSA